MFSLQYSLIKDLFAQWRIYFVRRGSPGNEAAAVLEFPLTIRLEPYTMFISSGSLWSMGAFSYSQSSLPSETVMGRYCSVANAVTVFNSEHPVDWISTSPFSYNPDSSPIFGRAIEDSPHGSLYRRKAYDDKSRASIHIGNDVWIGQNVQLKRGIRIGDGAVLAAGSVVTRNVEPFLVVGGVPAKPIRQRFPDKVIERILALQWWKYQFADFHGLDPGDTDTFLDGLEERTTQGSIHPYTPEALNIFIIKSHLERKARRG